MTNQEIIKKFREILDKNNVSFFTPNISGQVYLKQGVNFDIVNFLPDKTKRTYVKIESIQQAKEVWHEVLYDFPEEEVDEVFDKYVPINLNQTTDMFFSIYHGKR